MTEANKYHRRPVGRLDRSHKAMRLTALTIMIAVMFFAFTLDAFASTLTLGTNSSAESPAAR